MSSTADLTSNGYEPLAPSMIRDQTFSAAPKRGRAYDAGEVDLFVARVGDDAEFLHGRIRDLVRQVEDLEAQRDVAQLGADIASRYAPTPGDAASIEAQLEAERIIEAAEDQAEARIMAANEQADEIAKAAGGPPPVDRVLARLPDRVLLWQGEADGLLEDAMRLVNTGMDCMTAVTETIETIATKLTDAKPDLPPTT